MGNFTVNQYIRIGVVESGPRIVYVLVLAEIPALQLMQSSDLNGDGTVDELESSAYLETALPEIGNALQLAVDAQTLSLRPEKPALVFADGQAGLTTMRLRAIFVPLAPLLFTGGDQQIALSNTYQTDRLGWREIIVTNGDALLFLKSTCPQAASTAR